MLRRRSAVIAWLALLAVVLGLGVVLSRSATRKGTETSLASNPVLDPGTSISGPAPAFTLTDQFGRRASLSAYRGRVVILAFNDSECTTVCPLTTTAMVDAKEMLGARRIAR